VTPKVALVCPAKIVTLLGTVAQAGLPLESETTRSEDGATETVTEPLEAFKPPFSWTVEGFKVTVKEGVVPVAVMVTFKSSILQFAVFTLAVPAPP
jgi:hypothetical protein